MNPPEYDFCLRTGKRKGEDVRRTIIALGLLDRTRKIISEGDSVYFPVTRRPEPHEIEVISKAGEIFVESRRLPDVSPSCPKSVKEFLQGLIPQNALRSLPKSYDIVGDIIVIERLLPEAEPYRKEIAEALLRVHKNAKTVLIKAGKVDGPYRIPLLDLLAGEDRRETVHSEYGVRLRVDLSKAYFSPRLGYERNRVASLVRDGETVVDMFAGVGPFSIMIAKRHRSRVFAIDINPDAVEMMQYNLSLNRLKGEVIPICGDASALSSRLRDTADRVIMNLPAQSLDFLDAARQLLKRSGGVVHIYLFSGSPPIESAVRKFAERASNVGEYELMNCRAVKPTAPKEWIVSIDAKFKPL
ncbi:MAG: class I SAM-dependent methyltransferase family protein [Candidatus Verstraetearchaeota archaeon]|nr:class I SAM-dependent methyltransferase family protein [Candidatus Verstraetearchaeota archaeon]